MTDIERRLNAIETATRRRIDGCNRAENIEVTNYMAPIYKPIHADLAACRYQNINLPGGRGSGKSSFVSLEIVDGVMKDKTGCSNGIVFRRAASTMRDSVYSQIAWAIDVLGVSELWEGKISPLSWTYKPTGAQIIFRGLDDSSKLKSIKPKKGIFRYVWFEEFSELPGENFTRSVLQSVVRGGANFTVFRSFNPPISKNNWANVFVARPDERGITIHTNYLDIPAEWLGENFIYEAERLKEVNEVAYRHEYLGEATGSGGEVFPNIITREITDEEIKELQYVYSGIDFGFAVDPAVFMRVAYDRKSDSVYFLDEIYKKHCSNKQLAEAIKQRGYDKTGRTTYIAFERMAINEDATIICDSAEPKSISDLRGEDLNAIACKKFAGSVLYGIKWLQHRRLIIDPARTPNAYREFVEYEYMTTKDGEFLSDVPDANNHCIDAVRYALDRIINNRGISA